MPGFSFIVREAKLTWFIVYELNDEQRTQGTKFLDEMLSKEIQLVINTAEGRKSIRLFLEEGQKIGLIDENFDIDGLKFIGSPEE